MILLLDNYDSFVHNLARYIAELGFGGEVRRSDALSVSDVRALRPTHIVLSPGPCTPAEAGICTSVVAELGREIPILGVCLGHQCIGAAYGARIVRGRRPLHGKTAPVLHDSSSIFAGIPNGFMATRYHSLVIDEMTCPPELVITARSPEGEIMAVQHAVHPVVGVQFHPESVATEWGYHMLAHFLGVPDSARVPRLADMGQSDVPDRMSPATGHTVTTMESADGR